jgi:eukaryotic-like serine/threonine-protein kinase
MSLAAGDRIGPYEVLSPLGAGGMGEVYRARDTRLGRDVAIKLLPLVFATDPDRLARLAREARLLAALNHPHIATIHGLEEAGGVRALVMELVEGPTLAERLEQSSRSQVKAGVPLADALRIAGQIAQGLEAAHEKGIVHRDLKPGNIKLRLDGSVKVLDFGLARAFQGDDATGDLSQLPTITTELHGGIVGTPAYMSPEQARGQTVDKRTDVWAFGCVLYEMLTGRTAFPGKTISDSIAAILEREPEWNALPADTPPSIRQLLRRCLEKDPNRRLHDVADARIEIDDVRSGAQSEGSAPPAASGSRLAWMAALFLIALVAAAGAWALRPVPAAPEAWLEINTPPTRDDSVSISPDGLKVVYVVTSPGQPQLWLRSLNSMTPRLLPGTERASLPFWSPDSRSIGFFADTSLKRTEIDGGSVRTLWTRSAVPIGGTWNKDGIILFADNPGGPILRISSHGGEAVAATRVEMPQRGHAFPKFLPDGRHFLFYVTGAAEAHGVYLGELGGGDTKRLVDSDSPATYTASGHLLFVRDRKLLAQRFDPDSGELTGQVFPVDERRAARTSLSASAAGPIAYRTGSADSGQRQLLWVDRTGREIDKVLYADTAAQGPSLSRDGGRVGLFRFANGNMDLWSYETRRRTWDRLTFGPGDDIYPLWSADGGSIVFGGARQGSPVGLYRRLLNAPPESEELLLSVPDGAFPMDWSADGRFVLFVSSSPKGRADLWALPLTGDRKPFEVVKTEFSEGLGQFSPDGQWIAYESDKTGRLEVYVRPFPGPGIDLRVSTEGGAQARWNPNGTELFYVADDDRLMAVPIRFSSDRKTVEAGAPSALFATTVGSTAVLKYRQQYVVSPDGQSFVMNSVVDEASASPIIVMLNWKPSRQPD